MSLPTLRTLLRSGSDRPIQDQRKDPRHACEIPCYLFDAAGSSRSAVILDRSQGGVRISSDGAQTHDTAAYVLRLDTGVAYAVKLAWRVGATAGYVFVRRVDRKAQTKDAALSAIGAAWRAHISAPKA